ncbi:MAG: hypothetical protein V1909_07105, partial [Candidatus Micrarchaeota archaeon]
MGAIATVRADGSHVEPAGCSVKSKLAINTFVLRLMDEVGTKGFEQKEVLKLARRLELENVHPEVARRMSGKPISKIIEIASWTGYSEVGEREVAFQMIKDALEIGALKDHHNGMVRVLADVVSRREDPMTLNAIEILQKNPRELAKVVHLAFSNQDDKVALAAIEFAAKFRFPKERREEIKNTLALASEDSRRDVSKMAFETLVKMDLEFALKAFMNTDSGILTEHQALDMLQAIREYVDLNLRGSIVDEKYLRMANDMANFVIAGHFAARFPFSETVQEEVARAIASLSAVEPFSIVSSDPRGPLSTLVKHFKERKDMALLVMTAEEHLAFM